jgi:two-component system sensor histidine kinase/response regulator
MMGGTIGVESEIGRGSRFFFTIPLRSRGEDRRQHPGVPPGLRSRHVLVCVPNATMREAVFHALRSAGLAVTCFGDTRSATAMLASPDHGVEAAILDWRLNPTGIAELLELARDKAGICPDRLLVLASQVDAEEAHATLRTLGLGVLLIKPASPSTLFEAVARAFGVEQRGRCKPGIGRAGGQAPVSWQGLCGLRVLLVEDNAINQEVAAATLRLAGLSVSVCSNGLDAVAAVAKSWEAAQPFAVVLMDRHMPGMDGIDTTRQIRTDPRAADLPIIAMTADVVGAAKEECQAAGMNDFVSKPFEAETLLEVIARWATRETLLSGPRTQGERLGLPASLPGIDVEVGLRYLGGEATIYRGLLLRFRSDFAGADRRVADLLSQGKVIEAEREVHSMKGLAGQMGAHELRNAAAALQAAIKAGDPKAEQALAVLADSLSTVIGGLAGLPEDQVDSPATVAAPPEDVARLSELLSTMVLDNDPRARRAAERLRDALCGAARSQAERLVRLLDRYDFEGARHALDEVVGAMKSQGEA